MNSHPVAAYRVEPLSEGRMAIAGELLVEELPQLRAELQAVLAANGDDALECSLRDVESIDTAGVQLLVALKTRLAHLRLVEGSVAVVAAFSRLGLLGFLDSRAEREA